MDKPNFNAFTDELRQEFQERHFLAFHLDVGILDVGCANPKDVFCIGAVGENAGVVGGVGD